MNTQDIARLKTKLLEEKALLEKEIAPIGKKDPSSPGGYDATSGGLEVDSADDNEMGDKFEEIQDNNAVVTDLEKQLVEVKDALSRIDKGTYGTCEVGGEPLDSVRLEANPSSRTCIAHAK